MITAGLKELKCPATKEREGISVPIRRSSKGIPFSKKSVSESLGGLTPRKEWRLAPPQSASKRTVFIPFRAKVTAKAEERKLFPVPPLPPPTARIRVAMFFDHTNRAEKGQAFRRRPFSPLDTPHDFLIEYHHLGGQVAQSVEREPEKLCVGGSIPFLATTS